MPTTSPRALGAMLSGAALAGWLAGSTLSPPVAVTQVAAPRPSAAPIAAAELPRLAWPVAMPRVAPPAPTRNPFLFRGSDHAAVPPVSERPRSDHAEVAGAAGPASESVPGAVASPWRLSGIAVSDDGDTVAVVSGGGDVFLVRTGDALPGGDIVEDVGPAYLVVRTSAGALTLRLP